MGGDVTMGMWRVALGATGRRAMGVVWGFWARVVQKLPVISWGWLSKRIRTQQRQPPCPMGLLSSGDVALLDTGAQALLVPREPKALRGYLALTPGLHIHA